LPRYQTDGAAGMDLHAALAQPLAVAPFGRARVPTGIALAIPVHFEGQVRPRSGLAARTGLTVLNAPGTIDSDYRGEVHVLLVNLSDAPVTIEPLERIAQLVIAPVARAELVLGGELEPTSRGEGGMGSTGRK
jgi:dUTP pyrophosphatase